MKATSNSYVSLARIESACHEFRFICYDENTCNTLTDLGFNTIYNQSLIEEAKNLGGKGCDSSLFIPLYVKQVTMSRIALHEKDTKVLLTGADNYFLRNPFDHHDDGIMVSSSSAEFKSPSLGSDAAKPGLRFYPFVLDGHYLALNSNGIICFTSSDATAKFFMLVSGYVDPITCETGWAPTHFNKFLYDELGLSFVRNYTHPGLFQAKLPGGQELIAFSNVMSLDYTTMADPISIHAVGVGNVSQRIDWLQSNTAWSLKSNWLMEAQQASLSGDGLPSRKFADLLTNSSRKIKIRTIVAAISAITETIQLLLSADYDLTYQTMKSVLVAASHGPDPTWPQFCQDSRDQDTDDFIIFSDSEASGTDMVINQYRSLVHNFPQHAARFVVLAHDEVAAKACQLHGLKHIYVAQVFSLASAVFPKVTQFRHGPQMFARLLLQTICLNCGVSFVASDADVVWGLFRTNVVFPKVFPLFPSPSQDFLFTADIARQGITTDAYKLALNGTWYFDHFGSEFELLDLCNGLMGVRATNAARSFYQSLTSFSIERDYILTEGGWTQVVFNILMYDMGIRINRSSFNAETRMRSQNSSLHLAVSVVCEETFVSPCQSGVAHSTPLFAHANCVGHPGPNANYANHTATKERWMRENGFWFVHS